MKQLVATVAFVALLASANESTNSEAEELGKQLAAAQGTGEIFTRIIEQCLKQNAANDPKAVFQRNAFSFGGISPQSAYWPEIEKIFQNHQQRTCNHTTAAEFERFVGQYYADNLSVEELKSVIAFFDTGAGKHFSAASQGLNMALQKFEYDRRQKVEKEALANASDRIREIVIRYQKDPK